MTDAEVLDWALARDWKQSCECMGYLAHLCVSCIADVLKGEVIRLRAMALTCCACKTPLASLEQLKAHIVACPEHPIAQYVKDERKACEQLARAHRLYDTDPKVGIVCHEIANKIENRSVS